MHMYRQEQGWDCYLSVCNRVMALDLKSEDDEEIPQSQSADQPTTPRRRATGRLQ